MSFPRAFVSPEERARCARILSNMRNSKRAGNSPARQQHAAATPTSPIKGQQHDTPNVSRPSSPASKRSPSPSPAKAASFERPPSPARNISRPPSPSNPNPSKLGKRKDHDFTLRPKKATPSPKKQHVGDPNSMPPVSQNTAPVDPHPASASQAQGEAVDEQHIRKRAAKPRGSRPINNETGIDGHLFLARKVVNQSDLHRVRLNIPQAAIKLLGEELNIDLQNAPTYAALDARGREYTFGYKKWEKSQVFHGSGLKNFFTNNNIQEGNTLRIFINRNSHTFQILKDVSQQEGAANPNP